MIKFISYDGEYPNLCSGVLVLEIDGKTVEFPPFSLESGGGANWREGAVWDGPWDIDSDQIPDEYKHRKDEILEVVNANVEWGCCGGCL